MTNWILTIIACVIVTELVLMSPLRRIMTDFRLVVGKAAHIVKVKAVSDHWKQKAILAYAKRIFVLTVKLVFLLLGLVGVLAILVTFAVYFDATVKDFLISRNGILLSIGVPFAYMKLRSFLDPL